MPVSLLSLTKAMELIGTNMTDGFQLKILFLAQPKPKAQELVFGLDLEVHSLTLLQVVNQVPEIKILDWSLV